MGVSPPHLKVLERPVRSQLRSLPRLGIVLWEQRFDVIKQHVNKLKEEGGIRGGLRLKDGIEREDVHSLGVKERAKRFETRSGFDAATYRHLTNPEASPSYLKSLHADTQDPRLRGVGYNDKP